MDLVKTCNLTITITWFKSNWNQRVQGAASWCRHKLSQEVGNILISRFKYFCINKETMALM